MDDYADEMRLKNTLSHEVRVTQTSRCDNEGLRALSACSQVQLARVGVRVIGVDVVCVVLVLIARVDIRVSLISQVHPLHQCQVHRRGDVSDEGCHQESCHCHHDEEELCDQFW